MITGIEKKFLRSIGFCEMREKGYMEREKPHWITRVWRAKGEVWFRVEVEFFYCNYGHTNRIDCWEERCWEVEWEITTRQFSLNDSALDKIEERLKRTRNEIISERREMLKVMEKYEI